MSNRWYELIYDERLGIERPVLHVTYDQLTLEQQDEFEMVCQRVCAQIPPKIKLLEQAYMDCYERLKQTDGDEAFYEAMEKLNDISSRICDLNVLFLQIEGSFLASRAHS